MNSADPPENPYAAPLQGELTESPSGEAPLGLHLQSPPAPWSGGWLLMFLVVGLLSGLGLAAAIEVNHAGVGGLLIPIGGLGLIAVIVRFLHSAVNVEWPIYLLISAGFGVVSYFAFIPVCFVVGLPAAIVMSQVAAEGPVIASIAIFLTVMVCGLIFTLLLRLYFKHRYRRQWLDDAVRSSPSESEPFAPGDPYGTPRRETPREDPLPGPPQ